MSAVLAEKALTYRFTAPNALDTPKLARDHVANLLTYNGHWALVDTARLLVSECVTNVYQHTRVPRLTIDTTLRDGRARVSVFDTEPCPIPVPLAPVLAAGDAESGRGLALVSRLAAAWGTTWCGATEPEAKSVWFELRTRAGRGASERYGDG